MVTWNGDVAKITVPTPFAVGDVNVYLIRGEALTLIDAGVKTKEAWDIFTFQLSQLGYTPEDIEQVVLTHHHPDHVGFLDWLPDGIQIYGHPYCVPWLNEDENFFAAHDHFYYQLFQEFGIEGDFPVLLKQWKAPLKFGAYRPITDTIQENDHIPGLVEWMVMETPGHAQSHLSFYRGKDGILIAGDHVLATISSNPLLEPPLVAGEERPKPQLQYNSSLKKLLNYNITMTYTGHGADIAKVHPLIERRLQRQQDRSMQVKEMLKGMSLSTYEICKGLFPAVYQKELGLTLSETTAQLDFLLSIGEIRKAMDEKGVSYFSVG